MMNQNVRMTAKEVQKRMDVQLSIALHDFAKEIKPFFEDTDEEFVELKLTSQYGRDEFIISGSHDAKFYSAVNKKFRELFAATQSLIDGNKYWSTNNHIVYQYIWTKSAGRLVFSVKIERELSFDSL